MSVDVRHTVDLDAPADKVWRILTDFSRWPQWRAGGGGISGKLAPGRTLKVSVPVATPKPGVRKFRVAVIHLHEGCSFGWKGTTREPAPGAGFHSFFVQPLPQGCRFHEYERIEGPLGEGALGQAAGQHQYESFRQSAAGLQALLNT